MEEAKIKMLIIEDDKAVQTVIKMVFEKAGYQVFSAFDAMQGMMMAKQLKPNIIVLDIMLPAGGGFAVYERVRMLTESAPVPILIYSAMDRLLILEKIKERPTVRILSKGATTIEQLVETAARLIAA